MKLLTGILILAVLIVLVIVYNEFVIEKTFVELKTDKHVYQLGESIKIDFENNKKIYYCSNMVNIYNYVNGNWIEINYSPISGGCECRESVLYCPILSIATPKYRLVSNFSFTWNQLIYYTENSTCDNETYTIDVSRTAERGDYKVEYCYFENVTEGEWCKGRGNICLEREFELV